MQIQTPDWVKHAVFYQIFPDRFARSQQKTTTHHPILEPWEIPPTLQGCKGGNLWGVLESLDYLQELGITAIYLNPIFQSASNHRYNTHDYYQVDPLLGGNEALHELLKAVHERNMKLILDGVFNHVGRGFFFFHDIVENGPYSPWVDWFVIHDWPIAPYTGDLPANYECWGGFRAMPKLNHENPAVREYIMQVAEYWLQQGIDGWRLDVPQCIEAEGFWQEFRDRVKTINPQAYIVGEIWRDARQWLDGTQFDGVMNYLFAEATVAFVAGDRVRRDLASDAEYHPYPAIDAATYGEKIQNLLQLYPWEIQLTQLNLLDSHDVARMNSLVGEDWASVELATLLMLTFPGAPCIYYGNEVGLVGEHDPDCRRAFPPQDQWRWDIWEKHQQLISLRHNYSALRTGEYQFLYGKNMVYIFARTDEQAELVVAVNAGTNPTCISMDNLPLYTATQRVLYGNGQASWTDNRLTVEIPSRSGMILG